MKSSSQPAEIIIDSIQIQITSWTVSPSDQLIEIKTLIPKGFNPGNYQINIVLISGETLKSELPLQINRALQPEIETISPALFSVYPTQNILVKIIGKDIESIVSTDFSGINCMDSDNPSCKVLSSNDKELQIEFDKDFIEFLSPHSISNWTLLMADDTSITLPTIDIQDRIVPWNILTWIEWGFCIFLCLVLFGLELTNKLSEDKPPSLSEANNFWIILLFYTFIFIVLILMGINGIINLFYKCFSWMFIGTLVLISFNFMTPFRYAYVTGIYQPITHGIIRYGMAIVLAIIGMFTPFYINHLAEPNWYSLAIQTGILAITLLIGNLSLVYSNKNFPPNDVILNQIEKNLYQKGHYSLKKDLSISRLSETRVKKLLTSYYEKNRNEEHLALDQKSWILSLDIDLEAINTQIKTILEREGKVTFENFQKYRERSIKKILENYFNVHVIEGDIEFTNGRLFLIGKVDAELYTTIEQILYREGRVDIYHDHLKSTGRSRIISGLSKYFSEFKHDQSLTYNEEKGYLAFERYEAILDINKGFEDVLDCLVNNRSNLVETTNKFMDALWTSLNLKKGTSYSIENLSLDFMVFSTSPLDLESILPNPFPIILFLSRTAITCQQIEVLRNILNQLNAKSRFGIIVNLADTIQTRELIRRQLVQVTQENLAVFNRNDLINIQASPQEIRLAFMDTIQQQVELNIFSPYQSAGPVTYDMFFGREDEIRLIVNSIDEQSITILGARKIGKTSVLHNIRRILNERNKNLKYLDCGHIPDFKTFLEEINIRWNLYEELGISLESINDFTKIASNLKKKYPEKQIIFQLDEIDWLLSFDINQSDTSETLFRMFRSLAQEKWCQFIFSGERTILDRLSDASSCFFNFTKEVRLGLLDEQSARKLIFEPMRLVGVIIDNPEDVFSYIYSVTSGHPNLIQYLCDKCLNQLSEAQTRKLFLNNVVLEASDSNYRSEYEETFWSQSTNKEKILTMGIIEQYELSEGNALDYMTHYFKDFSIEELRRAIRYLTLNQIIINRNDTYQIQPVLFTDIILRNLSSEQFINDVLKNQEKLDAQS